MEDRVILVDQQDRELGSIGKISAHRDAKLHRAFSVFIFRPGGELLLQRRAHGKYHSAGLWSNACCGHPRPGETVLGAARRRLREEMKVDAEISAIGQFTYREPVGPGLWEHEYDHVLEGEHRGDPVPDPTEVMEWEWASIDVVQGALRAEPERFTVWFGRALDIFLREHTGSW